MVVKEKKKNCKKLAVKNNGNVTEKKEKEDKKVEMTRIRVL